MLRKWDKCFILLNANWVCLAERDESKNICCASSYLKQISINFPFILCFFSVFFFIFANGSHTVWTMWFSHLKKKNWAQKINLVCEYVRNAVFNVEGSFEIIRTKFTRSFPSRSYLTLGLRANVCVRAQERERENNKSLKNTFPNVTRQNNVQGGPE